jgi:hypothetical protein
LSIHGLTEGIASIPQLLVLDLNISFLEQLTNKQVIALAKVLPPKLKNLNLSVQMCTRVDNTSVTAIADGLPDTLTTIHLNFKGCEQISNAAVEALAPCMPPNLMAVHINFEDCVLISEPAIIVLVRALPQSLFGAKINLQGTAVSHDKQKICRRLDRMRGWIPPVTQYASRQKASTLTVTSEKPLFLRSINHIVMGGAANASPCSRETQSPSAVSFARARSTHSLSLKHGKGHRDSRSASLPAMRLQKGANDTSELFVVEEEKALSGTLHCYFHSRTSTHGWSVNGSKKTLAPYISRPVQPPPSAIWPSSSEAMFIKPRTQYQGMSEPLWRQ